jgi:signal peptidase I
MGDNRNHSADSSFHHCDPKDDNGCVPGDEYVPVDLVVGKVFVLLWPLSHFTWLHRPDAFSLVPPPANGG